MGDEVTTTRITRDTDTLTERELVAIMSAIIYAGSIEDGISIYGPEESVHTAERILNNIDENRRRRQGS